tara:strand:- start:22917 stop:25223 length:2307 start_codon:yes stop_codon:yes gene_type:complete
MEKTFADFVDIPELEEGVNDPAIFKAVFLAGGPGSGKSFMVGQTGLTGLGFKIVNSDTAFEMAIKKEFSDKISPMSPENIFSLKGQSLRDRAKFTTQKRKDGYLAGRLGLVIDGTGREYDKISKQKAELEKLGYETAMIMVNTSLQTAVGRDQARDRTLGKAAITPMWKAVQQNIGKFSNLFKQNFYIVDNSDGADFKKGALSVYRSLMSWSKRPPQDRRAKAWIKDQKQQRNIKEELPPHLKRHFDKKGNVIKGTWKDGKWSPDKKQPKIKTTIKDVTPKGYGPTEDIKNMDMGDVIKDFYKSDAPQFKGKSKKKRREMAIAAKLSTEGVFDRDSKSNSFNRTKSKTTKVKLGTKGGKPVYGKSTAPQGFPKLSSEERAQMAMEDLRKWFGKGPKGDWVRVGTDGEIKGDCAREPGEGKPKCMPRSKAHSMSKDDRATSARRKRRKDPVADRKGKGGKPVMVKTDVKEDVQISRYEWGRPDGTAYMKALTPGEPGKTTKKNRSNGNKKHYKAVMEAGDTEELKSIASATHDQMHKDVDGTQDDFEGIITLDTIDNDWTAIFTEPEIEALEHEVDELSFEDMMGLGMYDEDELEDFEAFDQDIDWHDEVQITEVLSIQGRMKRRFAARRNRQKLKVARMRAARRAADPTRLKRRATRGARNMLKNRIARGRDLSALPPAEKARIEGMVMRFSGLVSRIAQRMIPIVRKNEMKRLKSGSRQKSQKAKKYNPKKALASASKQKGKKFKASKKTFAKPKLASKPKAAKKTK